MSHDQNDSFQELLAARSAFARFMKRYARARDPYSLSIRQDLAQALDLAEEHPQEEVGVVIDSYNVWWDPEVWAQIHRARGRILSYQVCDWLDPLPSPLMGRGMMGDGVIDFRRLTDAVLAAEYQGPIEVEIFNQEIWDRNGPDVLAEAIERFDTLVA